MKSLVPGPPPPAPDITAIQLNNMQHALDFCFGENVLKNLELFVCLAPYIKVMKMGMMITCANVQNH